MLNKEYILVPWWGNIMPDHRWVPTLFEVGIGIEIDGDWDFAEACCISEVAWFIKMEENDARPQ